MRAVTISQNPSGDNRWVTTQVDTPRCGRNAVAVRVAAAGVNRHDVMVLDGELPLPDRDPLVPGNEFSGTVTALGAGVRRWKVGDRVCGVTDVGAFAEVTVARADHLLPVPDGLSMDLAGAVPLGTATSWAHLVRSARLRAGQTVLVHGGASGVGTLAVQIAVALGARVLATAGSVEKVELCRALGAVAINYRDEDFVAAVLGATGGAGVNVVLDVVGAPYLDRNIAALSHGGHLLLMGYLGGWSGDVDLRPLRDRMATISSVSFSRLPAAKRAATFAVLESRVWPLIAAGAIRPIVHTVLGLDEAPAAVELLRSGAVSGKVVLSAQPSPR